MKLYYQKYSLTPFSRLNALDKQEVKYGLYLKIEDHGIYVGDYFPHIALGDLSIDEVLRNYNDNYLQNAITLAKSMDRKIKYRSFKNHLLNSFDENAVTKYKIKSAEDFDQLKEGINVAKSVRLDANGTFKIDELNLYLKKLDLTKIEYIEDPSHEKDWNRLIIPSASDFITNPHASYTIVKPNRKIIDHSDCIISSYMGSDWGRVLCTNFLHLKGNFEIVHGIHTPDLYQEQRSVFDENNILIESKIKLIREEILDGPWHEYKL